MKKLILLPALLIICCQLNAAGIRHSRSGKIMAAELTRAELSINALQPYHFPDMPFERVYAVVSIELSDMRVLSIFDYTLDISGKEFPCVALWRNNKFEYFTGDIQGKGIQQLLFVVDGTMLPDQKTINLKLKSSYTSASGKYDMELPFSVINQRQPTAPNRIPAGGLLELPEE